MKQFFFLYFLFVPFLASSQSKGDRAEVGIRRERDERGLFSVQNFSHEDSEGHHQNWFITQDRNGFIYSANGNGVLEYDGEFWRLISSPGLHAVRTVAVDKENVKWIGANRDLGYLEPDSLGFLRFKSLKDKIPPLHPLTGNIWQIFPDRNRILFISENTIYSWTGNQFRIIPHPGEIHRRYQVNGDVYFRISGAGMYRLSGETLQLIPDGEQFQNIRIDVALPYKNRSSVLFGSREAGLFVYNGTTITKFENEVDDYLIENNLYAGLMLSDSAYAFATLRGGVMLMDMYGKRIREITTHDGILNNQVYGVTQDHRNALWLALQTGISQIEPNLPYTFFARKSGLEGTVSTIVRHKGRMYVGTYDGLYVQEGAGTDTTKFRRVDGIQNGCFALLSLGEELMATSADGVFLIKNGKVRELRKLVACRTLLQWKKDPSRIFVGHRGGLSTIYFKEGQWQHEKDFTQVVGEIRSIAENDQGALWLGTTLHDVIKIEFPGFNTGNRQLNLDDIIIHYYDDKHGLPKETNSVYLIDGELLVHTYGEDRSLFKFDPSSSKFSKTTQFGKKFGLDSLSVYPAGHQKDGEYILLASMPTNGRRSYRFSASRDSSSGRYTVRRIYDERFRSTTENPVHWDDKDLIWFGGEHVTRYDLKVSFDAKPFFRTYVRKVTLGQDSSIYGGENSSFLKPVLKYSNNALRFEFASPGFMGKATNKYQYRLVGFDDKWSVWTKETRKDYTNLPEGDYQFLVRSQNIYGALSTADVFNFKILAPWYRTWWAYVIYLQLFIGFLFVILQLRARKLKSEKKVLGDLVAERTEEIRSKANQLKVQAEKLQELDRAKSRFFANISHEFRTPLTLIAGGLEDLAKNPNESKNQVLVSIIQKNTTRLRQLIEQLLDLSKLESGKLKLNVAPVNPSSFLRAITSSFSSWTAQKQILLTVNVSDRYTLAYIDVDVLEKIINNLLSNAIKFTPREGRVSFLAKWNEEELTVQVEDNGPGIEASKLTHIFERFYQTDDSNTRTHEGSGIGLALVKELVALHHGQITAESEPDRRTTFRVTIPIYKEYYSVQEIETKQQDAVNNGGRNVSYHPLESETYEEYAAPATELPVVLVVEDNLDLSHYIGDHLPDCSIILSSNGQEAVEKAIQHIPDLVISDVMMPVMDGIDLCKKIKEDEKTSHIPVILLTAKADIESRLIGLETGADDYMTKPFDARELQMRVRNLILQREKLRTRFSRTVILKPKDIAITSPDETFLEKVMAIVESQIGNPEFSVEDFQQEIGMSRMQLHRKLKALTGHSAGEFMRIQRLIRASEMLSRTDDNVTEVCYETGFTSPSYFTKCFKKQFGVTPKDYVSMHSRIH